MTNNLIMQQWSFAGGTIRFEIRSEERIGHDHYDRIGEVCVAIKLLAMELDAAMTPGSAPETVYGPEWSAS